MSGDTVTTFLTALKEVYSPDVVRNLQYRQQPFYTMVKKDNNFYGKPYYRIPVVYGSAAGTSIDFATASKNGLATSNLVTEFQVTRTHTYHVAYIDSELILAAENKTAAFLEQAEFFMDQSLTALGRDIGIHMYRDGWGSRGRISSTSSVSTTAGVTLSRASDAANFEKGMRVSVCLTANYGGNGGTQAAEAQGSAAHALIVHSVDRIAGQLTFETSAGVAVAPNDATDGCPTIAASAYLFLEGEIAADSPLTGPVHKIAGLAGWLPDTAPTAGYTWFGATRSNDTRLGGLRVDGSGGAPIIETINAAAQLVGSYGGKASHMFCSFKTFGDILNSMEGKVRYVDRGTEDGEIGFRGIEILTPDGNVEVFRDINCPETNAYLLELDSWKLCSLKDPVLTIGPEGDGLQLRAYYAGDQYELRLVNRGNLGCMAPSHNCNIKLA
jgi:hypothetical protein